MNCIAVKDSGNLSWLTTFSLFVANGVVSFLYLVKWDFFIKIRKISRAKQLFIERTVQDIPSGIYPLSINKIPFLLIRQPNDSQRFAVR